MVQGRADAPGALCMSLRNEFPKPQVPRSHYFFTMARGECMRTLAVRPWLLFTLGCLLPVLGAWYLCATLYMIFRDDMLAGLMTRQAEMQYAYEDRLANLRGELDRVSSRQLLDQDSFEGKVHQLLSRQAQLEGRAAIVASLAEMASGRDAAGPAARAAPFEAKPKPPRTIAASPPVLAAPVTGFAPLEAPASFPALSAPKPRPEGDAPARPQQRSEADLPVGARLASIGISLDKMEFQQVRTLAQLQAPALAAAARLKSALADAGLSLDKLALPGKAAATGGPFIPMKADANGSPFEREVFALQGALAQVERLRRILPYLPLRAPLPGQPDVTSGFGYRSDPFLGRAALHAGIDFREEYGAPVHATAAGRVVTAGMSGGYGNMVEIDHGNGLSTRYGHMSAILVEEGQWVEANAVVGRLGSTGRSTGPHLHYETRVDDEAVDPARFLRAGARLGPRE